MRFYIFFSVHERLFHPLMQQMRDRYGATEFEGFVWGQDQVDFLSKQDIDYQPLHVFSRDIVANLDTAPPADLAYLQECERRYEISIHRMIWSERHLLTGRSYQKVMQLTESIFKFVESAFDERRPDCVYSEDVSCLTSYIHAVVARQRGIPFWRLSRARLPNMLSVYSEGLEDWNLTRARFEELRGRSLSQSERLAADDFVSGFRDKPRQPTGMNVRSKGPSVNRSDAGRWLNTAKRFYRDPANPTLMSPTEMVARRATRIGRSYASERLALFDEPIPGEQYVLYPIHFQPEASTLVLAPYYLNQLALIEDISKSLPVGHQLYVKEHSMNRGRRSLAFYRDLKNIFGVRLLGPDVDTWSLIQNAAAIAVITGTMGWEGLLFKKPVITFGEIFFNLFPGVHQARLEPKDRWAKLFAQAIFNYQHDEEMLLKFVSAIQQTSKPGFIANPDTFANVLDPENIRRMASALAWGLGLDPQSA